MMNNFMLEPLFKKANEITPENSEYNSSSFFNFNKESQNDDDYSYINSPFGYFDIDNNEFLHSEDEIFQNEKNIEIIENEKHKILFNVIKKDGIKTEQSTKEKTYFIINKKNNINQLEEEPKNENINNSENENQNIIKDRFDNMRIVFKRHFFKDLLNFINKLIDNYNIINNKNIRKIKKIANKIYIRTLASHNLQLLELKIKDLFSKNNDNIKTISSMINENYFIFNEVLNMTVKELMDIYRNKNKDEKDYYKYFNRFDNCLEEIRNKKKNKGKKSEDEIEKEINNIKQQGINFEKIMKEFVITNSKPGPKLGSKNHKKK